MTTENNPPPADDDAGRTDPPDTDADDLGDDVEDEDGEPDTPESLKAERDTLRRTLAKVKAERSKLRRELAAGKNPPPPPATDPPAVDPGEIADRRARRLGGIAALTEAGLTKVQAKSALKLMDLESVDIDEDGDGDFEDAVAELRETFPGLFPAATPPARGSTRPPAGTAGAGKPAMDETTRKLLRQAGYRR
jgi:hypothetical protein